MEGIDQDWRKSSYSGNGGGSCIETASGNGIILIRDTKQEGQGPVLRVPADAWQAFADMIKRG